MMEEILRSRETIYMLLRLKGYKTSQHFAAVHRPEVKHQKPESYWCITEGITELVFIVTLHNSK